ncbi:sugar transferase [Coleofasciculus sp. H7-2]|uniref:sugar transferase n=1 Tax=Coleofasciculus sp. H7-2 TaxID=3351545 RepID=UPI00366A83D5
MTNTPLLKTKLDLREPVFTTLRKGIGRGWLRRLTLLSVDSTLLFAAWQVAETYGTPIASPWSVGNNPMSLLPILTTQIGVMAAQGLYEGGQKRCAYRKLIKSLTLSHIVLLIIAFFYKPGDFVSRSTFILSLLLSILFTYAGRLSVDFIIKHLRQKGAMRSPIFLICHPKDTEKAINLLKREKCYRIMGFSDLSLAEELGWGETIEHIQSLGIVEVFICYWGTIKERMFLYWNLRNAGITLNILPIGLEPFSQRSEPFMIGGIPSIKFSPPLITGSDFWIKRCFDFCSSIILLLLAAPIYLLIVLLIKLDSPGPVFYKQTRVGLNGKQFKVWKFRTMVTNADKLQKELEAYNEMKDGVLFKIKSDPRITKVGKFLRHYSLDELPQLLNVIFGEMSLVGPRPLPVRDVNNFSEHHFVRQAVLPGITGLWQVSGRSDITNFEQVIQLDFFYIENWSLLLDLQILMQTVTVLIYRKGAY